LRGGWEGLESYWSGESLRACLARCHNNTQPQTQLGMYLVSEVWYLGVAGFYFLLWKRDWLLAYRIQKKAAMPEPALIKVGG
jgi:hypothetical protein